MLIDKWESIQERIPKLVKVFKTLFLAEHGCSACKGMGTTTNDHLLGGQHAGEEWNFFQVVSEGGDEMHNCNSEEGDLDLNAEGPFNTDLCTEELGWTSRPVWGRGVWIQELSSLFSS